MNKHFTIRLSRKQIKRLKKIYKTEKGRPSQRAHIVLLYHQGYSMKEIAAICLCDRNTISEVLQRFQEHRFEGLYDQKRSGAPPILNEEDEQYLFEALDKSPLEYGYRITVWTIGLMLHLLRTRRRKTMSESTLRELLHRRGWVFKRPKHIPVEALPLEESEKQEILRLLNNPQPDEIILFLDESDFQWLPYLTGAWVRRGQELRIPTPGKNQVFCVFGAFDPHEKQFYYKIVYGRGEKNAKNFIAFLHQLRAKFKDKKIHAVIDNASIHNEKTKLLKKFREDYQEQMRIHFMPTRSASLLNPIERFWQFLKHNIASNHLYQDIEVFAQAFRNYVRQYQRKRVAYNFNIAKLIRIWENYPVQNLHPIRDDLALLQEEIQRTQGCIGEIIRNISMLGNLLATA